MHAQEIVNILRMQANLTEKPAAIISRIGDRTPEVATVLLWDAMKILINTPSPVLSNDFAVLDVVFHYYTDSE